MTGNTRLVMEDFVCKFEFLKTPSVLKGVEVE